jgi:hypothetical protein
MDESKRTNILLEELMSQFRVFGEGLQGLREEMNVRFDKLENQNQQEHQLMMQMIKELNEEQIKLKRAK